MESYNLRSIYQGLGEGSQQQRASIFDYNHGMSARIEDTFNGNRSSRESRAERRATSSTVEPYAAHMRNRGRANSQERRARRDRQEMMEEAKALGLPDFIVQSTLGAKGQAKALVASIIAKVRQRTTTKSRALVRVNPFNWQELECIQTLMSEKESGQCPTRIGPNVPQVIFPAVTRKKKESKGKQKANGDETETDDDATDIEDDKTEVAESDDGDDDVPAPSDVPYGNVASQSGYPADARSERSPTPLSSPLPAPEVLRPSRRTTVAEEEDQDSHLPAHRTTSPVQQTTGFVQHLAETSQEASYPSGNPTSTTPAMEAPSAFVQHANSDPSPPAPSLVARPSPPSGSGNSAFNDEQQQFFALGQSNNGHFQASAPSNNGQSTDSRFVPQTQATLSAMERTSQTQWFGIGLPTANENGAVVGGSSQRSTATFGNSNPFDLQTSSASSNVMNGPLANPAIAWTRGVAYPGPSQDHTMFFHPPPQAFSNPQFTFNFDPNVRPEDAMDTFEGPQFQFAFPHTTTAHAAPNAGWPSAWQSQMQVPTPMVFQQPDVAPVIQTVPVVLDNPPPAQPLTAVDVAVQLWGALSDRLPPSALQAQEVREHEVTVADQQDSGRVSMSDALPSQQGWWSCLPGDTTSQTSHPFSAGYQGMAERKEGVVDRNAFGSREMTARKAMTVVKVTPLKKRRFNAAAEAEKMWPWSSVSLPLALRRDAGDQSEEGKVASYEAKSPPPKLEKRKRYRLANDDDAEDQARTLRRQHSESGIYQDELPCADGLQLKWQLSPKPDAKFGDDIFQTEEQEEGCVNPEWLSEGRKASSGPGAWGIVTKLFGTLKRSRGGKKEQIAERSVQEPINDGDAYRSLITEDDLRALGLDDGEIQQFIGGALDGYNTEDEDEEYSDEEEEQEEDT